MLKGVSDNSLGCRWRGLLRVERACEDLACGVCVSSRLGDERVEARVFPAGLGVSSLPFSLSYSGLFLRPEMEWMDAAATCGRSVKSLRRNYM